MIQVANRYGDKLTEEYLLANFPQKSASKISQEVGCTVRTVYYFLEKYNIDRPNTKTNKHHKKIKPGDKFGRLTVVEREGTSKNGTILWKCDCECGGTAVVSTCDLNRGQSRTCGCKMRTGYKTLRQSKINRIEACAKDRNIFFDDKLDAEYFYKLFIEQDKKCAITGVEIDLTTNASVDRIDSTKGYIHGNVWWTHRDINVMKLNHTLDRFIELCEMVVNNKEKIQDGR